jgi:small subunit ribosomal protein S6
MRRYETIFILDPDLSEEERTPLYERFKELIPQQGGFWVNQNDWGSQKLAYEIKKKSRGYYVRFDYCGTGATVNEIERFCRIDDRVLKYMTVLLEQEADVEAIQAEMAAAEEARAQKEQTPEPQAPAAEAAVVEAPAASEDPVTPIANNAKEEEE